MLWLSQVLELIDGNAVQSLTRGGELGEGCSPILAAVLGRVCRDQGWRLSSQQEVQVQAAWTRFVQ